jgi:hypothetical protein
MELKRRIPALAIGSTVLAAAAFSGIGAVAAAETDGSEATYRVTVTNLAPGQPQTPPVVVLHSKSTSIVEAGTAASPGLQQLAENGDPSVLLEALATDEGVGAVAVAEHPIVSGGIPGAAEVPSFASFEVSGPADARRFSIASMLICTNDGFSIVHDQKLPKQVGSSVTVFSHAYDAGTETNTEAFADLVPPCQGLVGVSGEAEGSGASNPDLAEGGVVTPHAGTAGAADLDAMIHAVAENPALIVVERIS